MPRKQIHKGTHYNGYQLSDKEHEYYLQPLKKGVEMIESMIDRHSKVLQVRMDFRYLKTMQSDGTNNDISITLQNMGKEYSRMHCDPQYAGKREQVLSKNPHFHVDYLLNGSKKQSRNAVIETAEKHWANALGISIEEVHENKLVYPCNQDPEGNPRPNGYMYRKDDVFRDETKENMIRQMAYLTKRDEEDQTPSSTRKFFFSQYRQDYDKEMERRRSWAEKKRNSKNN